jgi:hypothetical protein
VYLFRKNESGFALVMVFLTIVVLGILVGAFINSSIFNIRFTSHQENRSKAYYAAQAGINHLKTSIFNEDVQTFINELPVEENLLNSDKSIKYKIELLEDNPNNKKFSSKGLIVVDNKVRTTVSLFQEFTKSGASFIAITEDNSAYIIDENTDWANFNLEPVLNSGDFKGNIYAASWDSNNKVLVLSGDQNGGNNNIFMKNLDGEWIEEHFNGGGINHIYDMTFNQDNGKFYSVNHNGKIHEAYFDGQNWITNATGKKAKNFKDNVNSIIGDNKFVFLESDSFTNKIYTYDIDENSLSSSNLSYMDNIMDVAYGEQDGEQMFVAVGYEDNSGVIYTSENGDYWNEVYGEVDAWELNSVTWTGNNFIAVGDSGQVVVYDFENGWSEPDREHLTRSYNNVEGFEQFVIASSPDPISSEYGGTIMVSKDGGTNWTKYDGADYRDIPKFKNIKKIDNSNEWLKSNWGFSN